MRYVHFLFVSFVFLQWLPAQILPPDLSCIRNDSLFWDLPVNNCGPFVSYDIYVSTSPQGPFSLLIALNNATQNNFHHPNPGGQQYYYYMQSRYNCPGQQALHSDTLVNRSPATVLIESVSVVNDMVQITWPPSSSAAVSAYIIYRTTSNGTLPIDTVYNSTSYLDPGARPEQKAESYFIVAMDKCGNTSGFDVPHFTIFVDSEVSPCEQSARLYWNPYQNWPDGIGLQEVWVRIGGALDSLLAVLPATDTSYLFDGLNKGDDYCFYIVNQRADRPAVRSRSNLLCFKADVVQPMQYIQISNVSVSPDNSFVSVDWYWNADAELNSYDIIQSQAGTSLQQAFNPASPLTFFNQYTDPTSLASVASLQYQIRSIDLCDSVLLSAPASTIHLSGLPQRDLTNLLSWTAFDLANTEVMTYELYRIVDGQASLALMAEPDVFTAVDLVDANNKKEELLCYYIVADGVVTLADSSKQPVRSRSNTVCVQQFSTLLIPNAFAPEGRNFEFKPRLVFGEKADYQLIIYNRWGQKLFETRDVGEGWNGKEGFRVMPQGVYTYFIRLVQPDGSVDEKRGTFLLLR